MCRATTFMAPERFIASFFRDTPCPRWGKILIWIRPESCWFLRISCFQRNRVLRYSATLGIDTFKYFCGKGKIVKIYFSTI